MYNIKFKCYVVIELKVTELNSNHTGQIQKYMNYYNKKIKDRLITYMYLNSKHILFMSDDLKENNFR